MKFQMFTEKNRQINKYIKFIQKLQISWSPKKVLLRLDVAIFGII